MAAAIRSGCDDNARLPDRIEALLAKGASAIPRKSKGGDPMKTLADPALWELVRKLAAHKKLRDEAMKLAEKYPDPAADE